MISRARREEMKLNASGKTTTMRPSSALQDESGECFQRIPFASTAKMEHVERKRSAQRPSRLNHSQEVRALGQFRLRKHQSCGGKQHQGKAA